MTPTPLCRTDSGRRSPGGSASPCAPSAAAGCPIRRRSHPAPKGWTRKGASACLTLSRLLLACLALTAASCQVNYHPYDTRVEGECGINAKNIARADAFIINDMLHYIAPEEQERLLSRCAERLTAGGCIIVREGDRSRRKRHRLTEETERWSTRILGFNKTCGTLHFPTGEWMEEAVGNVPTACGAGRKPPVSAELRRAKEEQQKFKLWQTISLRRSVSVRP